MKMAKAHCLNPSTKMYCCKASQSEAPVFEFRNVITGLPRSAPVGFRPDFPIGSTHRFRF